MSRCNEQLEEASAVEMSIDHHCKVCTNLDNSHMVQCDKCDKWYHYGCVGVTADIELHDFLCFSCETAKGARRIRKTSTKAPPCVPPVSTHADVQGTIPVPSQAGQSVDVSEAAFPNASDNVVRVNTIRDSDIQATQLSLATQIPPSSYAPSVTQVPFVPLTSVIPPQTTIPLRNFEQPNKISMPNRSMSFAMPPPVVSMPSCVILPPNTRAPGVLSANMFASSVFHRTIE